MEPRLCTALGLQTQATLVSATGTTLHLASDPALTYPSAPLPHVLGEQKIKQMHN